MIMEFVTRSTERGYEIESRFEESQLESVFEKMENIRAMLTRLDREYAAQREIMRLSTECEKYWVNEGQNRYLDSSIPAAYRVALSVLDGGNNGKEIRDIAREVQLHRRSVFHYLQEARGASDWYSEEENRTWVLTEAGIERIRKHIIPKLEERPGNELSKVLEWLDSRIFGNHFEEWLTKQSDKTERTDSFEYAVGILLSTLGFIVYQVGMYGDRFDIVAFDEGSSRVILCECTRGGVRKKASTLGSAVNDFRSEISEVSADGVVFTMQRVSKTDRVDLQKDEVKVVDITQIKELLKLSRTHRNPELLFHVIQKKAP